MIWSLIARSDVELETHDVVRMNLAVASGIPAMEALDPEKYVRIVDEWTTRFRCDLPRMEQTFAATPGKWKNDIRFFRVGMLQGFLGHTIGIRYIEGQKAVKSIRYTDPCELFLHGLFDTKEGTCGNMPILHVAIARRMGWPVSLACARSHLFSRFDDGEVVHNIECTSTHPGAFASDPDDAYIQRFNLPERAIACGSDLRKLSAREMLAVFIALRGRFHSDVGEAAEAEKDFLLARYLFPEYRSAYVGAMPHVIRRGSNLFDDDEVGHPSSIPELLHHL